jgi:hypothetical protein
MSNLSLSSSLGQPPWRSSCKSHPWPSFPARFAFSPLRHSALPSCRHSSSVSPDDAGS